MVETDRVPTTTRSLDTIDIPIVIPSGRVVRGSKRHVGVPMVIEGVEFEANLIEFDLDDLDVILGMDWLSENKLKLSVMTIRFPL